MGYSNNWWVIANSNCNIIKSVCFKAYYKLKQNNFYRGSCLTLLFQSLRSQNLPSAIHFLKKVGLKKGIQWQLSKVKSKNVVTHGRSVSWSDTVKLNSKMFKHFFTRYKCQTGWKMGYSDTRRELWGMEWNREMEKYRMSTRKETGNKMHHHVRVLLTPCK